MNKNFPFSICIMYKLQNVINRYTGIQYNECIKTT